MIARGKKIVLREKRLGDAPLDYAWREDPELARFDATFPIKMPFADYVVAYAEELNLSTPTRLRFAIEDLEGKHIGNCMLYDIDEKKGEAEMGIMIGDRRYWGKSYGTDVVTTLLDYVFENTSLQRIYLNTLDWNIRAQRCFEKCGFRRRGRSFRDAHTFVVMEVYRDEYLKRREREAQQEEEAGRLEKA